MSLSSRRSYAVSRQEPAPGRAQRPASSLNRPLHPIRSRLLRPRFRSHQAGLRRHKRHRRHKHLKRQRALPPSQKRPGYRNPSRFRKTGVRRLVRSHSPPSERKATGRLAKRRNSAEQPRGRRLQPRRRYRWSLDARHQSRRRLHISRSLRAPPGSNPPSPLPTRSTKSPTNQSRQATRRSRPNLSRKRR